MKVADLGSAVEANPSSRLPIEKAEIEKTGIQCQTLFYRAPEILFGDAAFGRAVDAWSLGALVAELSGARFWEPASGHQPAEVGCYMRAFKRLGTPSGPELTGLSHWPTNAPQCPRGAWPSSVHLCMRPHGVRWLDLFLESVPYTPLTPPTKRRGEN